MKKSLVLAMAMALGVTASAYAANPFSDVPAGHWAYDSVNKLAAAGVVDGYPDGTYGGDKLMTRYEMAQIVAKAMAKGANVDKLAAEFADELDSLGVRVANLEKKADNVKITGEVRYHYADNDTDKGLKGGYATKLRSRIWVTGQINDDWTYTGMLQNEQDLKDDAGNEKTDFQRAYVNGKLGGVKVQAGRYNLNVAQGQIYDQRFDGVQASYGKDVKLTAGYGKASASSDSHLMNEYFTGKYDEETGDGIYAKEFADKAYYAELSGKIGSLDLAAGYTNWDFDHTNSNDDIATLSDNIDIWHVRADYAFDKNFKLGAMYLNGDALKYYKDDNDENGHNTDDDGYVVTASYKGAKASQVGSWGLVAKYYDQGMGTYVDHTMNGFADKMNGFKGYSVFANYTFAKNIVGQVEYYDLDDKETDLNAKTLWSQLLFTF